MVATFHPRLHDDARRELASPSDFSGLLTCIRGALELGRSEPLAEPSPALTELGESPMELTTPSANDNAIVILHEGRFVMLDTGC
jgi:hypothetical protein